MTNKEIIALIAATIFLIGIIYLSYSFSKKDGSLEFQFNCDYCKKELEL